MASDKKKNSSPKLLSSGNPQIAKGDGDEVVQSYIEAMPGWKHKVGWRLDGLVTELVPEVRKAVRWNTPFYGIEGQGWFLTLYCYKNYVQVSFLNGHSLQPPPPVDSKQENVRYLNIYEEDELDIAQLSDWIEQGASFPGDEVF